MLGIKAISPMCINNPGNTFIPESQPRARWSQEESQHYDENGYIVGGRSQNWQNREWHTAHWEDSDVYPTERGGPWRGGQSSTRTPIGGYPSQPTRPSNGRHGPPRMRHPMEFDNVGEHVYMNRDGFQVHSM
jgi:hypothetical protein